MTYSSILLWVVIIGVFYVMLIMPERRRQKNMKSMMESLKIGDSIMTRGGIYGTISEMTEDKVIITTGPDMVKIEMARGAVSNVVERKAEAEEKPEVEYKEIAAGETTENGDKIE